MAARQLCLCCAFEILLKIIALTVFFSFFDLFGIIFSICDVTRLWKRLEELLKNENLHPDFVCLFLTTRSVFHEGLYDII